MQLYLRTGYAEPRQAIGEWITRENNLEKNVCSDMNKVCVISACNVCSMFAPKHACIQL